MGPQAASAAQGRQQQPGGQQTDAINVDDENDKPQGADDKESGPKSAPGAQDSGANNQGGHE